MTARNTELGKLCIICEGESTENNFCKDFIEYLENNNYRGCHKKDVIILPPPRENDAQPLQNARTIKKTRISNSGNVSLHIINGKPPLKWVQTGVEALKIYNEVWVLFDNDNHPARKEAFDLAKRERDNGGKLNIAYSSWSFEYFLLQHFEFLYHSFHRTEHRIHDDICNCCTANSQKGACNGILDDPNLPACISGYARKQGYWIDSKDGNIFGIIPNIWKGICNAYHVKWQTIFNDWRIEEDKRLSIYDQNPYLDTYRIILRLMNVRELDYYNSIETKDKLNIKIVGSDLVIHNGSNKSYIILPQHIVRFRFVLDDNDKLHYEKTCDCNRHVLNVDEDYTVSIIPTETDEFYLINFNDERFFLGIQQNCCNYSNEYLEKYHYNDL